MPVITKYPPVAQIITELTGQLVGGIIHKTHQDGDVTLLFAGLKLRGKRLTRQDILALEAGAAIT